MRLTAFAAVLLTGIAATPAPAGVSGFVSCVRMFQDIRDTTGVSSRKVSNDFIRRNCYKDHME